MHKGFPFQCIFSTSLPTFRKAVHCTKALHPLTRSAVRSAFQHPHCYDCGIHHIRLQGMDLLLDFQGCSLPPLPRALL